MRFTRPKCGRMIALRIILVLFFLNIPIHYLSAEERVAGNRVAEQISIYGSPILILISGESYSTFGTGVGAKYFLDRDSAIDIFTSASISGGGQYSSEQLFVRYQAFLGKSFNLSCGVAAQRFRWNMLYSSSSDEYSTDISGYEYIGPHAKYKTHSIGAIASLGNQWQWGKFTLGADWFTLYVPTVLVNSRVERFEDTVGSRSELKKLGERKARATVAFLPKLNIGFTF